MDGWAGKASRLFHDQRNGGIHCRGTRSREIVDGLFLKKISLNLKKNSVL